MTRIDTPYTVALNTYIVRGRPEAYRLARAAEGHGSLRVSIELLDSGDYRLTTCGLNGFQMRRVARATLPA